MFKQILSDLDAYIRNMKNDIEVNYLNEIQTAILLTGEYDEVESINWIFIKTHFITF